MYSLASLSLGWYSWQTPRLASKQSWGAVCRNSGLWPGQVGPAEHRAFWAFHPVGGRVWRSHCYGTSRTFKCGTLEHELELVDEVAISLASFAKERITPFVREEGGWSRLCSVFPLEEDYESQVWQGLVLVGVGLTLATLCMVSRRWCQARWVNIQLLLHLVNQSTCLYLLDWCDPQIIAVFPGCIF